MRQIARIAPFLLAAVLIAGRATGQDGQALGDAARQAKQQKQAKVAQSQNKDAAGVKAPRLVTNDEIPARYEPVAKVSRTGNEDHPASLTQEERRIPASQLKTQIEGQKNLISNLQSQIDQLSESIRFAPANCVSNCAQWNQRQREKEQQVETMKAQLDDQQKKLEDMQEQARKQGYGSSVYEP